MDGPQTHVLAAFLTDHLTGHPVMRIDVPSNRFQANVLLLNCVGQVIQRLRAYGNYLLLDFSHGLTWAIHLATNAAIVVAGKGKGEKGGDGKVKMPETLLTVHLRGVGAFSIVGHPLFLILPTGELFGHAKLKGLGPDPLGRESEFRHRFPALLRGANHRTVGAALLDGKVVAGLTNALKCDILFAARLHPAMRVGDLLASQVGALTDTIPLCCQRYHMAYAKQYRSAGKRQAIAGVVGLPHSIFGQTETPCPRCSTPIVTGRFADRHTTWFCPTCQALSEKPTLFSP